MTYYIDENDFCNLNFSFIIDNILNNIINMYVNIILIFDNITNKINFIYKSIIENNFDGEIYKIDYINNTKKNIYNLFISPKELSNCFKNNNLTKYNINNKYTIDFIKKLLNTQKTGYLLIKYFINGEQNTIIINLKNFYNSNITVNDEELFIKNEINNFINDIVLYDILHVSIDNMEITNNFISLKNSFKNDNISLVEFKKLYEKIYNKKLDNKKNLIITNYDLDEINFTNEQYLNFETLYYKMKRKNNN
tara:strand:- start:55 stop:807 length:753 start_codon:yes stop_codon:yes gene_type:complete